LEKSNGVISKLAAEGFDATARQSMEVIRAPAGIIENKPMRVSEIFAGMVYLPAYPEMGEAEILRMSRILSDHFAPTSGK
jgi:hypothetical protein